MSDNDKDEADQWTANVSLTLMLLHNRITKLETQVAELTRFMRLAVQEKLRAEARALGIDL
jgi:hypothetical protein